MGTHTTSPNLHTQKKQAMGGAPPTWIGAPVLRTFWPRTRPSVVSIAIVLTVLSPKCCATSSTTLRGLSCTSRAVRIGGRPFSNFTSTTAPITVEICPILPAPVKSAEVVSAANPCTIPAGPRLLLPPLRKDPLRSPLEVALITALEDDDDPAPRRLLPAYALLPNDLDCCSVCCLAAALLAPAALPVRKTAVKALLPDMAYSLSLSSAASSLPASNPRSRTRPRACDCCSQTQIWLQSRHDSWCRGLAERLCAAEGALGRPGHAHHHLPSLPWSIDHGQQSSLHFWTLPWWISSVFHCPECFSFSLFLIFLGVTNLPPKKFFNVVVIFSVGQVLSFSSG